jgi:cell wall-associated NlpC family hydrolase
VKRVAYAKQTQAAEAKGESNCPLCATGDTARTRAESTSSTKWTPTTFPRGAKAAKVRPRTARCSALPTIGLRVIDSPDAVLSATQDERLESLLKEFGPSDPFASLPFLSVDELKPGDIILRRSSALSSQMTELMIWSPYTHSALYVGDGMIIDSTWEYGVKTRSLADLLDESIRVSVLRLQGLTSDQAEMVVLAAQSKESAEYNFENVKLLGAQKLDALTNVSRQSLGEMIGVLGRAEYLLDATDNGKFACSELIVFAFKAADITLSQASGFTPGDMVRLGQAGFLSEVGRLQVPAIE